jgi:serine/threonine protein kinase
MGIVLKAFEPALHRPVAIKVLAPEYAANGTARKRFAREAQAAAAVIHDHVVPVHAVDAESTPPYLVMALIAGRSLQQRLDRSGPLELKEILRIAMQTASGLAAAHAQGLVHRDIKPANIMLENGVERVRITDFGLARAVDDVTVTQDGVVAGTPQYMAPEQARGDSVDQRADLFSLGSTMYEMCTGRAPFRGDSGMAVLRQVSDAEPPSIRSLNPDIPAWLEGIIRKLHAKNPDDRFQSAGELATLLEACLAHVQQPDRHPLPSVAMELGRNVPCANFVRRRRWAWIAASTVATALTLAGLIVAVHLRNGRSTSGDADDSSVAETNVVVPPPPTNPEDPFSQEVTNVRNRLGALEQSVTGPGESYWAESQREFMDVRRRVEAIGQQLNGQPAASSDPVAEGLAAVRRRVEALQSNVNGNPR